jgi:hypothetical protein
MNAGRGSDIPKTSSFLWAVPNKKSKGRNGYTG